MDFFAKQDHARRQTTWLVSMYLLAVLATIFLVYFVPAVLWTMWGAITTTEETLPDAFWWHPTLFAIVFLSTVVIVSTAALTKISQLRAGGGCGVALMLGGREILPTAEGFFERRLRNVVEEMAIASGVPVPRVFVMERERGINAFAAGYSPSDAVVAVSKGCMEALNRDELQGVIAHEFSHILNGDMALNLHLIGGLHGLSVIAVIGRAVRTPGEDGLFDLWDAVDGIKGAIAVCLIMLLGLVVELVGYAGLFFCRMIKAGVSRSRERLADAAAVQFTRNPAGLAGALFKIGRIDRHSELRCVRAEQVSHMCFGQGVSSLMFPTHPPLRERIRWLDPQFDGKFPRASLEDLKREVGLVEEVPEEELKEEKPDVVDVFTDPARAVIAGAVLEQAAVPRPKAPVSNPLHLLERIGEPMEHHTERARQLLASIPDALRGHLRDPYSATVVVYWMLLHVKEEVRTQQMDLLAQRLDAQTLEALNRARPVMEVLPAELRLPVLDLAVPVLRTLAKNQYLEFMSLVEDLIVLDQKINLTEFVFRKLLRHHLDPEFGLCPRRRMVNFYAIRGLAREASVLLSALAQYGQPDADSARQAFEHAADSLKTTRGDYSWIPREEMTWRSVGEALDRFQTGSFQVKRWLLGAALTCMIHDGEMTLPEVELFRVIADLLECPVPPWVAPGGTGLRD